MRLKIRVLGRRDRSITKLPDGVSNIHYRMTLCNSVSSSSLYLFLVKKRVQKVATHGEENSRDASTSSYFLVRVFDVVVYQNREP